MTTVIRMAKIPDDAAKRLEEFTPHLADWLDGSSCEHGGVEACNAGQCIEIVEETMARDGLWMLGLAREGEEARKHPGAWAHVGTYLSDIRNDLNQLMSERETVRDAKDRAMEAVTDALASATVGMPEVRAAILAELGRKP